MLFLPLFEGRWRAGNWWHTGSLPGTLTEAIRGNNGFNWVLLCNTRYVTTQMDIDQF